jgi:hypothetical protein
MFRVTASMSWWNAFAAGGGALEGDAAELTRNRR